MEERLHHFELHSKYFIVDIRYLSKVLFRFPIVVLCYYPLKEDKSSILFFKSKEFHMFILVVELNLAKWGGEREREKGFFPSSRGGGGVNPG